MLKYCNIKVTNRECQHTIFEFHNLCIAMVKEGCSSTSLLLSFTLKGPTTHRSQKEARIVGRISSYFKNLHIQSTQQQVQSCSVQLICQHIAAIVLLPLINQPTNPSTNQPSYRLENFYQSSSLNTVPQLNPPTNLPLSGTKDANPTSTRVFLE